MTENGGNLCKFQIICVDTSPLQEVELKFPPLKCGLHDNFLPKSTIWKGRKRVTLEWRNLTKHSTTAR